MNITLFSQIIQHLDRRKFHEAVQKYGGDKHSKGITSWSHLVAMLFCHLGKANSLREITQGLHSITGNLNHLGITGKCPQRSSLSHMNIHRDWRIFHHFYLALFAKLQDSLSPVPFHFRIKRKILLLDSTLITVSLSAFDWAYYTRKKGAVKLHTLLDYQGCMPCFMHITEGKKADVKFAQYFTPPKRSVIVADRAYIDFKMLYAWDRQDVFWVTRMKKSIAYRSLEERPLPEDRDQDILLDEYIELAEEDTRQKYPQKLRRVVLFDAKENKQIEFLTNQFSWTAKTIARLYQRRWDIEVFFKQLKQHLKIKSFVGTNENAVRIQIWTALITLLLLKYLKATAKYKWALSNLVAFLRFNLFVKISLKQWLDKPFIEVNKSRGDPNQNLIWT